MNLKKHAVIFDFSGVMAVADRLSLVHFVADALRIGDEEASSLFYKLRMFVRSGGSIERFWQQYAASIKRILPEHWLEKLEEMKGRAVKEVPGMRDLVLKLKGLGLKVALLSNMREEGVDVLKHLGYFTLFDQVVLSSEVGFEKPQPGAFYAVLSKLELPPQECLFVDDSAVNVDAAEHLGITSILFHSPQELFERLKSLSIVN